MMDDDITLASLNLRSGFLPEPMRGDFKRLIAGYIGVHLQAASTAGADAGAAFLTRSERAEELHSQMLEIVRTGLQSVPPVKGTAEMVGPLCDALAIHRRWVTAMETTVPPPILVLLFATAITAAGVVGYSGGLAQHRGNVQGILLAVFVSSIIFVIHELDTPLAGVSQSGQRPLIHLKALIEAEAAAAH
jgi:hypothetical protein